jgi:8-oxo-dGTP diphosphatase
MAERHTAVPVVFIALARDGEVLVTRRSNTGYRDGDYQLPSGHVEVGELPAQAAAREAREEVGVEIAPADLELVHVAYCSRHYGGRDRVDFYFRAARWTGEPAIAEPDKCDDLRWVAPGALPDRTTPDVRLALGAILRGNRYGELASDFFESPEYRAR